jgi:hypothetical protein
MQLDMSNAQMVRDENGRPFIIVREFVASKISSTAGAAREESSSANKPSI